MVSHGVAQAINWCGFMIVVGCGISGVIPLKLVPWSRISQFDV